jgi:hypothetical protein
MAAFPCHDGEDGITAGPGIPMPRALKHHPIPPKPDDVQPRLDPRFAALTKETQQ